VHSVNEDDELAWRRIKMWKIMSIIFCGEGCCDIILQVKIVSRKQQSCFRFGKLSVNFERRN